MAKERRRAPAKRDAVKGDATGKATAAKPGGTPPLQADPATLVEDGVRPHETTLHGTELEDFGLDVLPVVQPHKA
jgi:hypothetical protein